MTEKPSAFCHVVEQAIHYSNMLPETYVTVMVDSMQNSLYFTSDMRRSWYVLLTMGTRQFLMCIVGGLRYE